MMADHTSRTGVPASQVFDAFDALASGLRLTASAVSDDWQLCAYVAACRAIAAEAGWTLTDLAVLRHDSYLEQKRSSL